MTRRTNEQRLADLEAQTSVLRLKQARAKALEDFPMKRDCERARRALVRVIDGLLDEDELRPPLEDAVKALQEEIDNGL